MLDRGIRSAIKRNHLGYPLEKTRGFTKSFDLAFCNLECPISYRGKPLQKPYCFRADTCYFSGIREAGFNIFSLANNHTLDWGKDGLLDTKEIIEENNLYPVGAGKNQNEARPPIIIRKNGLRFAFLAYVGLGFERLALKQSPGPAQARLEEIVEEIESVREEVDFVIVSLHWGVEYQSKPNKEQVRWAHRIVDAGCDLLVGHHPHVLGSVEIYKSRFICYSLGNFVFDQRKLKQRQSGIFSCLFRKGRIDSVSFLPVILKRFQPNLAQNMDLKQIEEKMAKISKDYNTIIVNAKNRLRLTDSTYRLSFYVPVSQAKVDGGRVVVYNNLIKLVDTSDNIVDTLRPNSAKEILDGCFIRDSAKVYFIAIASQGEDASDKNLTLYRVAEGKIIEEASEADREYKPRKIVVTDLEGDSILEICVAANKKDPSAVASASKFLIYNVVANRLALKWSGTIAAQVLIDFGFFDINDDGINELITLESTGDRSKDVNAYQWCGFGFFGYKTLAKGINANFLDDIAQKISSVK